MEFCITSIGVAIAVSVVAALMSESVNWYLIYRHEDYKKLVKDTLTQQELVEKLKEKQMYKAGTQGLTQQKVT